MADGMTPHYCSACGEMHGGPHGTDPAVKIAQINADKEVRVAELMSHRDTTPAEELETQTEIAQIEADAQVGSAEALADAVTTAPEPVEPEPVEPDITDVIAEPEGEPEPPEVLSSPTPRESKKKSWWGAYS